MVTTASLKIPINRYCTFISVRLIWAQINQITFMKKLLLCLAVLAGMTITACSEEETTTVASGCVTCTITSVGVTSTQEVCNQDGTAYIDGTMVGNYEGWMNILAEQGYSCQ
jgi:hypothetical protein